MDVLVYLVPLALLLGLVGLAGFLWSLRSGQYDDLDGAAWRALNDDNEPDSIGGGGRRNQSAPNGSSLSGPFISPAAQSACTCALPHRTPKPG